MTELWKFLTVKRFSYVTLFLYVCCISLALGVIEGVLGS